MKNRINECFKKLSIENKSALVTFTMMGDPNIETSFEILKGLPGAGADIIEIGTPFTDPMADGPIIQESGKRALKAGITLEKTLDLVKRFREENSHTPIILMGYFNPIYIYGVDKFIKDAGSVGLDGLIVVDLPPEEDEELCIPAISQDLDFIRLVAPTTGEDRLPVVLKNASGFIYYISITGITGGKGAEEGSIAEAITRLRKSTKLPICVGFGVKTSEQASQLAKCADGVVVGSALIDIIGKNIPSGNQSSKRCINAVLSFVNDLAEGVGKARKKEGL